MCGVEIDDAHCNAAVLERLDPCLEVSILHRRGLLAQRILVDRDHFLVEEDGFGRV